jgi:phospholipid/cholesterol/gamma-HCH transport system substrate-binding protein
MKNCWRFNYICSVTLNISYGRVNNITIAKQWEVIVELQIKTDFPISKSSVAIYEPGFMQETNCNWAK